MYPKFIGTLRKNYTSETTRWFANSKDGEGIVITYGFMSKNLGNPRVDPLVSIGDSFERYSAAEKTAVKNALKAWSAVADIRFVEVSAQDADVMFGKYNMPYKVNGQAGRLNRTYETGKLNPTDIWLDWQGFLITPYGRQVTTHEIGHVLGLEHPLKGKAGLRQEEFRTSIMAYDLWGEPPYHGHPTKLGLIDAAAVQSIYGPAKKKLGKHTYHVGKTKLIWDGGGVDTVSAASAKAKAHINLNDGSWNWVGKKAASILDKGQSWLGHFTFVENAVGSKFGDVILGNELDNVIRGGKGNDTITGGRGADTLSGGAGNDTFVYKAFTEMGTREKSDRIVDFGRGDKIDLRGLGVKFIGKSTDDAILNMHTMPKQFYLNVTLDELRFDANGDGIVDHLIRIGGTLHKDQLLI